MRPVPILDTSTVVDLAKSKFGPAEQRLLKSLLPRHGCPLSPVTLLELFRGLRSSSDERFSESLEALRVARSLSRGRVLPMPPNFIAAEVFGVKLTSGDILPSRFRILLNIAAKAKTKIELMNITASCQGRPIGIDLERIEDTFKVPSEKHTRFLTGFLNHVNPEWEAERFRSGASLPERGRAEIKERLTPERWRIICAEGLAEAVGAEKTPEVLGAARRKAELYFTYISNLLRDVFLGKYRFEKNSNDLFDGFQLYYLTRDAFCLVTEDARLISRTRGCSQSDRVLTLRDFLAHLSSERAPEMKCVSGMPALPNTHETQMTAAEESGPA